MTDALGRGGSRATTGPGLPRAASGARPGRHTPGGEDIRLQQAREHAAAAEEAKRLLAAHLAQRDQLIRRLYDEGTWSYSRLARALGLTPELIAKIIRPQQR